MFPVASNKPKPLSMVRNLLTSKIQYSRLKINPFSGVLLCIDGIRKKKIPQIIDEHLGNRVKQARYKFSDILLGYCYMNLCGGQRLDDIHKLQYYTDNIPQLQLPSSDRLSDIFRSWATDLIDIKSKTGKSHEFNINLDMNRLMLDILIKLNLLPKGPHILDYDNVIVANRKYDCRNTYEKVYGYQPGYSFIGRMPVYIENRNGNSGANYLMHETLERCLYLLKEKNIKIGTFRSDAAAYTEKVINLMESRKIKFFIRAKLSRYLKENLQIEPTWAKAEYNNEQIEVTSMDHYLNDGSKRYRLVVKRHTVRGEYKYWAIITNDWDMSDIEVITLYNQRGTIEQNFDILKNDFNLRRLPFSFLNENTVFMVVSAITCILYHYLVRNFSKQVDFVKKKWRLRKFVFQFITVPGFLSSDGELLIFSNRDYDPLIRDG